jgi:DNA-binding GntR family transcriptional regulator
MQDETGTDGRILRTGIIAPAGSSAARAFASASSSLPPREIVNSAAELTYRRLEEAIVTMEIAPGATVNEAFLSEFSGFGRSPVRDAVRRLSFERLLVVKPKRGIYVTEIDPVAQQRLLEVRQELERLAFRGAARRAMPEQRRIFIGLGDDFRRSAAKSDALLFIRTDKVFNDLSVTIASNEFATDGLLLLRGLSRRFWFRYFNCFDMLRDSAQLHADVAVAIANGDLEQVTIATDRLSQSAMDFAQRVADTG